MNYIQSTCSFFTKLRIWCLERSLLNDILSQGHLCDPCGFSPWPPIKKYCYSLSFLDPGPVFIYGQLNYFQAKCNKFKCTSQSQHAISCFLCMPHCLWMDAAHLAPKNVVKRIEWATGHHISVGFWYPIETCHSKRAGEIAVHMSTILLCLGFLKHGIQRTHTGQQADCSCTPRFQSKHMWQAHQKLIQMEKTRFLGWCGGMRSPALVVLRVPKPMFPSLQVVIDEAFLQLSCNTTFKIG